MKETPITSDDGLSSAKIIDAARAHVRRFGESKTNVVDIAKLLGTSHTTIYRHFRSKAEVFDAIVIAAMKDEEELAQTFVKGLGPASERLAGLVMALHRRKRERFANDLELYQLYRRVVADRPQIVQDYALAMIYLVQVILDQGVQRQEWRLDDVAAAAGVIRDAITVFVHPAHVEAAAKAGIDQEASLHNVLSTLICAFKAGVRFSPA